MNEREEFTSMETELIMGELLKCEDIEDLKKSVLPALKSQQDLWGQKILQIISEKGYTKVKFAELCGVSRVTVDKWCKGAIPKNRETFLRIGMAAGYNIVQMNQLLQRYGRYPALYSKSLEDCVCIFVINNSFGEDALNKYLEILGKIKENISQGESRISSDMSTADFDQKLSEVHTLNQFESFVEENTSIFAKAYHKFYTYVKANILANYSYNSSSINDMAVAQGWSSSLVKCVSAINNKKWYPTRNKIISLGLHFSMEHDQIDEMLELAYMEPLCAKNIFECVIIFILEDASLNDILNVDSEEYNPDELCEYAREIMLELGLPELEAFISELPEMSEDV